jgi:RNA polymerase subunit RPABC4/transcription elongation factor Spt4/uncharacterized tellurite resistance protein B-like protein
MLIIDQEKVHYLANVLLVAFADKSLSPRETAALEEVRKSIDAKKGVLAGAQKAVEGGSYTFIKAGSFADQVKNLEDMLFVALTDKDLNESESHLISEFGRLIGVSQGQVDQLVAETSCRCDSAKHDIACPSCSQLASAQARFCPSCGQPLTSQDAAAYQVGFDIPKAGYAIEFSESTAAGFATALELAKATGTMQTATKNKKTWYLVSFPPNQFADMVPLASALSGMRNRRVYFDGQEVAWDEVFGFIWCASQRATAYRPVEYCFGKDENRINPWGCKQARMEWTDWAQWFSYGRWQKTGLLRSGYVFVFDKERIRHELATNLYRYRFCPYVRMQFAEAVLRHLPDQVEVKPDGNWKYNRAYESLPGAIKVIEREGSGDFVYTNEYYADGVRPKGYSVIAEILKKALDECKATDVEVGTLLSK